ncbi:MAG TPA: hypothetical protein VHR47_06370 [Bacillota bacterium]|nr:hypothetical protein [Bacillota bacterium]
MGESIIVVATVIVIFGIFYIMAHKAEQVVKGKKLEQQQKLATEMAAKPSSKAKKR